MTRGKVAKLLNINRETIRYYENLGLISPVSDKETGYRYYDDITVSKLELIIRFKKFGFRLKEIKEFFELIKLSSKNPAQFRSYIASKITDLDNQIEGLKSVRESLISFRDREDKESCRVFSKFIENS